MLPGKRKKIRAFIWLSILTFLVVYTFYKIDRDIKPTLFSISNTEARIMATESINRIVNDELANNVKYSDFVNIIKDSNGDITAIELNTVEMNKFGTSVALRVQEEMKIEGGRGVSIPLGVVTGSSLLSYFGPKIKVKVLPMGSVSTDFKSELMSAGINQTRYKVYINVSTNLQILIPLGKESINVISMVPIAETLIVGKIPDSYFNTNSDGVNVPNVVPIPVPGD
jgi:sporulation protein YunB